MVHVSDLSKYFGGKRALGPVSLEIARGETVGFLGLNGVGKTTLLRILACDLRPSAGSVVVDGVDAVQDPLEVRRRVGFLPEVPPVYEDMTVEDYLVFVGRLRGLDDQHVARRVPEVEEITHVEEVRNERIGHLSQGYRQRVGVAQAIVHQPELLILDEPTHDLDPVQIVEMRTMIRDLEDDHTILISSHILHEISETCDRLLVLNDGVVIARGTEDELSARLLETRRLVVAVQPEAGLPEENAAGQIQDSIRGVEGVREVEPRGLEDGALSFSVTATGDQRAEVCRTLVEAGHSVVRLDRARLELENVFIALVKGGNGEGG